MAVNAIIRASFPQDTQEVTSVSNRIRRREARYDASAECPNVAVVGTPLLRVHKKIELILRPIYAAKGLEKPGFGTAPIQPSNDLQDSHSASLRRHECVLQDRLTAWTRHSPRYQQGGCGSTPSAHPDGHRDQRQRWAKKDHGST